MSTYRILIPMTEKVQCTKLENLHTPAKALHTSRPQFVFFSSLRFVCMYLSIISHFIPFFDVYCFSLAIESGGIQIMPTKDAAGRIVMMFAPDQKLYKTDDNWIRCLWYMFWQVSKDGGDLVRIHTQPGRNDPISLFNSYMMTKAAFPLKTKAIHWCYDGHDESAKQVIIAKKVHFYNQNERSHFREHFTTDYDEMCFKLETFGTFSVLLLFLRMIFIHDRMLKFCFQYVFFHIILRDA